MVKNGVLLVNELVTWLFTVTETGTAEPAPAGTASVSAVVVAAVTVSFTSPK